MPATRASKTKELTAMRAMAAAPDLFRSVANIEHADGSIIPLADNEEPWQVRDFAEVDPALIHVAGRGQRPAAMKFFWERPRGHSKSSDAGLCWLYLLLFSLRPIEIVIVAGDQEQAALIRKILKRLIEVNPWCAKSLSVQSDRIINVNRSMPAFGAEAKIISSDAPTSYGLTPNVVHIDEIVHWRAGEGEELFHSLFSSAAKRPGCLLLVGTNAGTNRGRSWQWQVREAARESSESRYPDWVFSSLPGPLASWITPATLAEQKRILPAQVYNRLWNNDWTGADGNAIDPTDLAAAICLAGPQSEADPQKLYVCGVDASTKHDVTAVVTLSVDPAKRIVELADCRAWKAKPGREIDLEIVLNFIRSIHHRFQPREVRFDPFQMTYLAQTLRRERVPMVEVAFTNAALDRMASAVIESFQGRQIRLYREPELIRDLERMELQDLGTRWRLIHPRDERGHGDRATAFSLALAGVADLLRRGCFTSPHQTIVARDPGTATVQLDRNSAGHRRGVWLDRGNTHENDWN